MNLTIVLFYSFVILCGLGAMAMVLTKELLQATIALLVSLLSVAAIFILLGAEFLGITQILVYAGGIVVLMIFGIMLTQRMKGVSLTSLEQYQMPSLFIGGGFFFLLLMLVQQKQLIVTSSTHKVQQVGAWLMTDYALPFEWSGLLLLVCLIASAFAATAHQKK